MAPASVNVPLGAGAVVPDRDKTAPCNEAPYPQPANGLPRPFRRKNLP